MQLDGHIFGLDRKKKQVVTNYITAISNNFSYQFKIIVKSDNFLTALYFVDSNYIVSHNQLK